MPIKRSFIGNSFGHPHQQLKEQLVVPMFEKPLTPSDVGKLNRLVIPKQHAEKHFPVASSGTGDSALLLSFEDEEASGRWWRFRYSYWSSSQSFVLTKGWRSYVKEKGLGAGDVIAFGSHRVDSDHWFIGWRRGQPSNVGISPRGMAARAEHSLFSGGLAAVNVVIRGDRPISSAPRRLCQPFVDDATRGNKHDTAVGSVDIIQNNQTRQEARNPRRLRLFGVNLECQVDQDTEPSTMGTPPSSSLCETYQKLHSNQTFYPSGFPSYGKAMMHQLI